MSFVEVDVGSVGASDISGTVRATVHGACCRYDKMAVSVRLGARVPVAECRAARAHKNDPHQWKLLCVEEPFDLTNTARSVYDPDTFDKIVATFRASHERLARGLRLADAWPQPRR